MKAEKFSFFIAFYYMHTEANLVTQNESYLNIKENFEI